MALFTVAATGPKSAGSTWVGGAVPGPTDDWSVPDPHVLTVDVDTLVNTIDIEATSGPQCVVLGDNVKLTTKGFIGGGHGATASSVRLDLGPGSEACMDATAAPRQWIFGELAKWVCRGVEGNHGKFTKIGSNDVGFLQSQNYAMTVEAAYCDIIGYTQQPCMSWPNGLAVVNALTDVVVMDHVQWDGCGMVDALGPALNDMPFKFTNCTEINSVSPTYSFRYAAGSAVGDNATFDGNMIAGRAFINPAGVKTDVGNFFLKPVATAGTTKAAQWKRNLHVSDGLDVLWSHDSDEIDCIFWMPNDPPGNDHWITWPGNHPKNTRGCLFLQEANDNQGDVAIMPGTPASPIQWTFENCILPPGRINPDGHSQPGDLFSVCFATSNAAVVLRHCTIYVDGPASGIYLGEHVGGDYPGQGEEVAYNIFWNRSAAPSGFKITGNVANATQDTDWAAAANVHDNHGFGLQTGSRGNGYDYPGTGTPGAGDSTGDPNFVGEGAEIMAWAQQFDPSIDTPAKVIALLKTKNNDGVTGINTQSIKDFVFRKYYPRNPVILGTADAGTNRGAVQDEYASPGIPAGALTIAHRRARQHRDAGIRLTNARHRIIHLARFEAPPNTDLTPGTGALTLTGFAPAVSVSNNVNVIPSVGQLALTGFAPTVSASNFVNVIPGTGQLALSGFAPAVQAGAGGTPGTGALALTGFAPTVSVSNHVTVIPSTGALLLTGYAPTVALSANRNLSPGTGALVLSGFAPAVLASDFKSVVPATGLLTLTGFVPVVVISGVIAALSGRVFIFPAALARDSRATQQRLIRRSTNVVELREFYDEHSRTWPTDAAIRCTILESTGVPVVGATNLPMAYAVGTQRFQTTYQTAIPAGVDLSGTSYLVRIIATLTSGATREFNMPCTAIDG